MLGYYDPFILGLTATPSLNTMGYIQPQPDVAPVPFRLPVVKGVNVGFKIFRIRTGWASAAQQVEAGSIFPSATAHAAPKHLVTLTKDFSLFCPAASTGP